MKKYIVYKRISETKGQILRHGNCQDCTFKRQAKEGEFVISGTANDVTQKVIFDGLDENGKPINPRVIDKTVEEMKISNLRLPIIEIPEEQKPANITKGQWQQVLNRLAALDEKVK